MKMVATTLCAKKEYCKPRVLIEDLQISNFVAGACGTGFIVNYSEDNCTYLEPTNGVVFFSAQCEDGSMMGFNIVNPNPASPFAGLCYHRPMEDYTFFNS